MDYALEQTHKDPNTGSHAHAKNETSRIYVPLYEQHRFCISQLYVLYANYLTFR